MRAPHRWRLPFRVFSSQVPGTISPINLPTTTPWRGALGCPQDQHSPWGRACRQGAPTGAVRQGAEPYPGSASAPGLFCTSQHLRASTFSPPMPTLAPMSWGLRELQPSLRTGLLRGNTSPLHLHSNQSPSQSDHRCCWKDYRLDFTDEETDHQPNHGLAGVAILAQA